MIEENNIIGKVPVKVKNITLCFISFPQEEIIRIFQNKFKPINLYRLCHMQSLQFNAFQDLKKIGIEDGMVKLWKMLGTYKNFKKSFFEVWANVFHNYIIILVSPLGKEALDFYAVIQEFYSSIYKLSTVYEWQKTVLSMAIEAHTCIITQQPTDPAK